MYVLTMETKKKLLQVLHSPLISHSHYSQEINNTSAVVCRLLRCLQIPAATLKVLTEVLSVNGTLLN